MSESLKRGSSSPLCSFVSVLFWLSSTAGSNTTSNNTSSNKTSNGSLDKEFSCKWEDLDFPITYGPGIACSLCILIGGFLIIFGFKYQRASLFVTGFSSAALVTYVICLIRSSLEIQYVLLITAALGIFGGILCTTVIFCGLFTAGLVAGFSLSMAFLLAFATLYQYTTLSVPVGVTIGVSVVMAGAGVWWKRVVLIISSSIYGGVLVTGAVDYFIEDFRLLDYTWRKVFLQDVNGEPCVFSWIIVGVWPLFVLVGLLVQFLKTGKQPPRPKKDFHNKRYSMGSPFYSAPEDIEMTELLGDQGQPQRTPALNTDHTPQGAPLLGEERCHTCGQGTTG